MRTKKPKMPSLDRMGDPLLAPSSRGRSALPGLTKLSGRGIAKPKRGKRKI
jgi:hypothetical protein